MRVFLSAPFSSMITREKIVEPHYRSQIEQIISGLERNNCEVYCDMRVYNWRIYGTSASQAFWANLNAIQNCDLFIAINRPQIVSAGVELELGVAYAIKKRIVMFNQADDQTLPFINKGLIGRENVQILTYQTMDDIPPLAMDYVSTFKSSR